MSHDLGQSKAGLATLSQNRTTRAGLALGALIGVPSLFSFIVGGIEDGRNAVNWAVWIWERAATPWLGIFALVLIGVMLWRGTRQVVVAEEKGGARRAELEEAHAQQIAILKASFEFPVIMARIVQRSIEILDCQDLIVAYSQAFRVFEHEQQQFLGNDIVNYHPTMTPKAPPVAKSLAAHFAAEMAEMENRLVARGVPEWPPAWREGEPVVSQQAPDPSIMGRRQSYFDPEQNREFQAAQNHNFAILRQRLEALTVWARIQKRELFQMQMEAARKVGEMPND